MSAVDISLASTESQSLPAKRSPRWKAAGIHLCFSMLVAISVSFVVVAFWYPEPLLHASGGIKLLSILLLVDVVIGPLLTFIVFDTSKKTLKFDLLVIALLQISALSYGVYVVMNARPVFMVFYKDRFDVVSAADLRQEDLRKVKAGFRIPNSGPKFVSARMPDDPVEREDILISSVNGGKDLYHMPQHYIPYDTVATEAIAAAKSIDELMRRNSDKTEPIKNIFSSRELDITQYAYLPLRARHEDMAVIVSKKNGAILGVFRFSPW